MALATAGLWAATSMLFSAATDRVGASEVNIVRLCVGAVLLVLTIIIGGIPIEVTWRQVLFLAASGIVGLTFGDSFLFMSMRDIGARMSMLVMSSVPIFSSVLSWFLLGEGLGMWEFVGIVLTVAGIALVILRRPEPHETGRRVNTRGVVYGFLGAIGQAGGLMLAKEALVTTPVNSFLATFIRIATSLVFLIPMAMLTGGFVRRVRAFQSDGRALAQVLVGSIVGPYLGITFSLIAITHANVGVASAIMSTVPIIMLPLVRWIDREELHWRAWVGALIAVGGTAILFLL